jgi:hypothetical protein
VLGGGGAFADTLGPGFSVCDSAGTDGANVGGGAGVDGGAVVVVVVVGGVAGGDEACP